MNYLEITGTLLGILYLYWEYKASPLLWIVSIAMPAIYLKVFYDSGLYADFWINIYYIVASVYGLVCWLIAGKNRQPEAHQPTELASADKRRLEQTEDAVPCDDGIRHTPRRMYPLLMADLAVIFIVVGVILKNATDSTVPWADAFTTALSIVAMWMLAKKYVEQWIVWIIADVALSALYAYKDLWFTGALYLAYAIVAWFGYRKWKRMMK